MTPWQDPRHRDRPRDAAAREHTAEREAGRHDPDPLAALRAALQNWDSAAFADCFAANGWIRVPRPEGDVILRGPDEIARAGYELRAMLGELSWTPSQRFLSAGQVVEEAVVQARMAGDPQDEQIRVSMRVVTAFDPAGGIGSLTLWIDWAALRDPLGVDSARGAASALVAYARAQDARGLQVIESDLATAPLPGPAIPKPPVRPNRSVRPAESVLWWRQHRGTLAGSVMAVLTVAVLGWVAQNVMTSPTGSDQAGAGAATRAAVTGTPGAAGSALSAADTTGAPVGSPSPSQQGAAGGRDGATDVPVIIVPKPSVAPQVQRGYQYRFEADVLFKTNSTVLSDTAQARLKQLATDIQAKGVTGNVQVNGYTDDVGGVAFNLKLSMQRADAVAEALRGYLAGSKVVELQPQAFGESRFVATNATSAGRRMNRRVVVVLPEN